MAIPMATPIDDDDALLARTGISPLPPAEEGLFRADGWLRRIHAEPALIFGGGRALLLEIAHPLVAAGVGEHSNFRSDPFGRLQRTLDAMRTIAYGDRAAALAAGRSVERAHGRVRGVLAADAGRYRAGTAYSGRDPDLVRWVWATLVDTAIQVYEIFVEPLSDAARESYYAEQCGIGRLLGVPAADVPKGHAAFRAWFDACVAGEELCVTPLSREIAAAVLAPPAGLADGGRVQLITAALLPERLRDDFGLKYGAEERARFDELLGSVRRLRAAGSESRRRAGDLR
jgi:uncharacterized protein (DUF2236 family)